MDHQQVTSTGLATKDSPAAEFVFEDPVQRTILACVGALVAAIGIPGNLLVMVAVLFSKKLQTKTNAFVVNLACSDLAACLILPFQVVALLNDSWPLSEMLCTFVAVVVWVGLGSSIFNLTLIAYNRFTLVTKSSGQYHHLYSKKNLIIMLASSWIIPIVLITVPPLCGLGGIGYSERYKICSADSEHPLSEVYSFVSSVLIGIPCLIIIVVCYVKIYRFIRKKNRELFSSSTSPGGSTKSNAQTVAFKRQVKVTKNLFLVVCSYIICIMPFTITCMKVGSYRAIPWVSVFLISNCCVNPLIYGFNHPQFREVFRNILSCKVNLISEPSKFLQSFTSTSSSSVPTSSVSIVSDQKSEI